MRYLAPILLLFLFYFSAQAQLKAGDHAPDFNQATLDGEMISLADFDSELILLDFWAGWCGPCIKTFKIMKPLYEKFDRSQLEILGISYDNDETKWRKAVAKHDLPWVHIYDKDDGDLYRKYGIFEVPTYILINKEGEILETGLTSYNLKSKIKKHLGN